MNAPSGLTQSGHADLSPAVVQAVVAQLRDRRFLDGTVALRGATVITMRGDEVIQNADIVVTDNRIVGVGKRGATAGVMTSAAKMIGSRLRRTRRPRRAG